MFFQSFLLTLQSIYAQKTKCVEYQTVRIK